MNHDSTQAVIPPMPRDKSELLERIHQSRAALEETIRRLSDVDLTSPGVRSGWSVKDHLTHLATWEQSLLALLEGRSRHAAMGVDKETYVGTDLNGLNAIIHQRNKDRPLSEALTFFRQSHEQILAALEKLTDADLFKPYSFYQPDDPPYNANPVLRWIINNTYEHYQSHQASIQRLVIEREIS